MRSQGFIKRVHIALAIAEYDRGFEIVFDDDLAQCVDLFTLIDDRNDLRYRFGYRSRLRRDADLFGVHQKRVGKTPDFRRHRGREKQCLANFRQQRDDFLDIRNKSHVEHPIRLVDYQNFDIVEQDAPAFEMIEKPPRGCDQHVDAAIELFGLLGHRHASDQERHGQLVILAINFEIFGDLSC